MDHEDKILNYIAQDENISQRQLAKLTDLSVGHLNLLLHKMVNKGLVKIEKVNVRSLKYLLTPEGIARNTKRTYNYIKNAVKQVLLLKDEMNALYEQYHRRGYTLYIDGYQDEIYQILYQITKEELTSIKWINNIEDLKSNKNSKKKIVIVWQKEKEEVYKELGIDCVNLLGRMREI